MVEFKRIFIILIAYLITTKLKQKNSSSIIYKLSLSLPGNLIGNLGSGSQLTRYLPPPSVGAQLSHIFTGLDIYIYI